MTIRLVPIGLVFAMLALIASLSGCSGDDDGSGTGSVNTVDVQFPTPEQIPTVGGHAVSENVPTRDEKLTVFGLAVGESLDLRLQPGPDTALLGQLLPAQYGMRSIGQTFETEDGQRWWLVADGKSQGWVPARMARVGTPVSIGAQVSAAGAQSAVTMDELTDLVLQAVQGTYGTGSPIIATRSDIARTVDVVGASSGPGQLGVRYEIVATVDGSSMRLVEVLMTPMCIPGQAGQECI